MGSDPFLSRGRTTRVVADGNVESRWIREQWRNYRDWWRPFTRVAGMWLDAQARMRCLALALVSLLAACPSEQNPGSDDDRPDAGPGGDAGVCEAKPTCEVTIRYTGPGTNV